MLKEVDMTGCKPVGTPGVAGARQSQSEGDEELLSAADATLYRRQVARLNYLAQDRIDLSFSVKEVARTMSAPCKGDLVHLKRIVRYLQAAPQEAHQAEAQAVPLGCRRKDMGVQRSWFGGAL